MPADAQLYFGGDIYTVDDACPAADAVGVRDGRIVAVGAEPECRAALGEDYDTVDLRGRALLPGFIDTHLHPVPLIYFDLNVDLRGVATMHEMQARLRGAEPPGPDAWIVGMQFEEQDLDDPRLPTRHDLDAACPDRPAAVLKHDGHTIIANTAAIATAGATAATPDPDGGVIDREPDGTPAGPFRETASRLIFDAMPMPDLGAFAAGAAATFGKLTRCGITSAGVILQSGADGPAGAAGAFDIPLMQSLLDSIPVSMYGIIIAEDAGQVLSAQETPLHAGSVGAGHRVGSLKIYADGTFGSCTACMRTPFSDQPDRQGFMTLDEDEIYRRMAAAHAAGLQVAIHAIGDGANRRCIDLYDRLLRESPRADHRHRLEHASLLDGAMIADVARLGIVVSTTPLFIHSEKTWLHRRIGGERAKHAYPLRALLDAGVHVAGASDAPIESVDVLHAIECCVTREGFEPQQGITAAEAVSLYTLDAAYAQHEETVKGSITPGKRADLVILDRNPVRVPAENIRRVTVERTIVGGRVVYDREAA